MNRLCLLLSIFLTNHAMASSSYLTGPSTLSAAAISVFGSGAGVGTTSCLLCHNNSTGGFGTVASGFGTDFNTRASALHLQGHALSQSQLQDVFNDTTFRETDSDGDGVDNATEITANSNPNQNSASASDSSGGGCGFIANYPYPKGPGSGIAIVILPFLLIFRLRKKVRSLI